jgi:hypothetical protein
VHAYAYVCTCRFHASLCLEACALVPRGVYGCPDEHTHTHIGGSNLRSSQAHTLVRARTCGCKNTCVCRWLGIDGRASVYLYNVYIHITIYIPIIYLFCTYTYACMWVCTDTLRTQASMRTCAQADAARIDGCTCISRHPFS